MAQHICGASFCDAQIQLQALDFTLREANHRIANSLQAVMAAAAGGRSGGIPALESSELMARISAIAAVHRMLSASDSCDAIVIGDYLAKLAEGIGVLWSGEGASAAGIAVHHGGETVAADVAVRLGMIVNELVTNSFKYAYEDGARGEIRIAFSIMDGAFVLIVADDGRGIDDASGRRRGMGSRLIDEISAQLDASFSYQPGRPGAIAVLHGAADILLPADRRTSPNQRSSIDRRPLREFVRIVLDGAPIVTA